MSRLSELQRAALLYVAFILLFFQSSWRTSWIASPDLFVRLDPAKQELVHGGEDLRQFYSWFRFASDHLRAGVFPSWTPFAGAGQPFVGKQQNGVFYPLNVLIYLCNDPSVFLIELALRYWLAAIFTFLLLRKLGAEFIPAFLSGCVFMISNCMTHWGIHAYSASAAFVPCVLLLTEYYLDGFGQKALSLLPFAVALCFLGGHSESAVRGYLLAGIYLSARLWTMRKIPTAERVWAATRYIGFASLGALLSLVHLLPSAEYYLHSYTHVWRNLEEFAFSQHHVARSLRLEDAPLLISGAIGLALFGWALKKARGRLESRKPMALGWATLSAAGLALFLAAYGSLGMTMDFWPHMTLHLKYDPTQAAWVGPAACAFGFFVWTFIGIDLLDPETPGSIKVFGAVLIVGLALIHRTPVVSHIIYRLPLLKEFLPELSPETDLSMAIVAAFGFHQILRRSRASREKKRTLALLVPVFWAVLIGGYLLSFPLRSPLIDRLGIGENKANAQRGADPYVSILDGGQLLARAPLRYDVRIRIDRRAGEVRRVLVGLAAGSTKIGPVEARLNSLSPEASYYKGVVEVPFNPQGQFLVDSYPFAVVDAAGGRRTVIGASEILVWSTPRLPEYWFIPLLLLIVVSGALLAGPQILTPVMLALMAYWGFARGNAYFQPRVPLRSELLPPIAALASIRAERDPSRIFSFDEHFFGPELSSDYGIADFRTWDALDVLEHIYYLRLTQALAQAHPDLSQKLLDVANVKYVLAHRNEAPPFPGLKHQDTRELSLFLNPGALPRAVFYTDAQNVAFDEFQDWRTAMQRGLPLVANLLGGLDPRHTLLLTDAPGLQSRTPQRPSTDASAEVQEERIDYVKVHVHAPAPGYLFLSDTYFPGWEATVDGQEASILRAWINFRAVPMPAGEHIVEFVYRPLSLILGAIVSILATILLLGWWRLEYASTENLGATEALVIGNVCLGVLYWGVWCLLLFRGASWSVRLGGLALIASLAFPLSLARKKR